jgi:non-ribosomal peptide synthetase component F
VQAGPGRELELRVQWDTDVFDAATIEALIERFRQVLVAMAAHPGRRLLAIDLPDSGRRLRLDAWGDREPQSQALAPASEGVVAYSPPTTLIEQILAGIYAQVLGVDRVGVEESFFELGGDSLSAMRAVAAINTALDEQLTVPTLFEAPSVRALSQQLGNAKLSE